MKSIIIRIPAGQQYYLRLAWLPEGLFISLPGRVIVFQVSPRMVGAFFLGGFALVAAMVFFALRTAPEPNSNLEMKVGTQSFEGDAVGFVMHMDDLFKEVSSVKINNHREDFLVSKQMLITRYLIEAKVSRLDQLPDQKLLELNQKISDAFIDKVLNRIELAPHVYTYFVEPEPLKKLETSLMEQVKYNVPASIKLAQSALETAYGRRVVNNNYFGIKDKSQKVRPIETTEYYTEEEYQLNRQKVVKHEKILRGGQWLYKCRIRDSFCAYQTPWESFRGHSVFLSESSRYSPLFTKGKDYKAWADKIGSSRYGGVGYATSPIYGELLKKIIERYHLDLLDH